MATATDPPNLPAPPDEIESLAARRERWRALVAPAGQIALAVDGVPAQLGLDGVAYAPLPEAPEPTDRSPEGASRSLGTDTTFAEGPTRSRPQLALALPAKAWEAPQLTMWGRLDVRAPLVRDLVKSERHAKCQRTRFSLDGDVKLTRFASGAYNRNGLISCNGWSCPCCGPQKARGETARIGAAMAAHMRGGASVENWRAPDLAMITLAPPHSAGTPARVSVERLFRATQSLWERREWARFVKRFGVVGRIRGFDHTHGGPNGLHSHFHIGLFLERAWVDRSWVAPPPTERAADAWCRRRVDGEQGTSETIDGLAGLAADERRGMLPVHPLRERGERERIAFWEQHEIIAPLVDAWAECCIAAGIPIADREAFARVSLVITPAEHAVSYFQKWGLSDEVGAPTAKHRSHLRLLDLVAAGYDRAGDLYREFVEATKGCAWLTGVTDICNRLGVDEAAVQSYSEEMRRRRLADAARNGTPIVEVRELHLVIRSWVWPAVARLLYARPDQIPLARAGEILHGMEAVEAWIDAHEHEHPDPLTLQSALTSHLWAHMAPVDREIEETRRYKLGEIQARQLALARTHDPT